MMVCNNVAPVAVRRTTGLMVVAGVLASLVLMTPAVASEPEPSYRVHVGDKLSVRLVGREDLSGEYLVGADSTIRLPMIGALAAAGRSRQEIEEDLTARLSRVLDHSTPVVVDVAAYRPVFVVGDVLRPGEIAFVPGMSAMQAYAAAGGISSQRQMPTNVAVQAALAQRDVILAQADLNRLLVRRAALDAALAGHENIALPPEIRPLAGSPSISELMDHETALLRAENVEIKEKLQSIAKQRQELAREIGALEKQIRTLVVQVAAIESELTKMQGLASRGLATSARLLDLKRIQASTESSRHDAAAFLSRARRRVLELEADAANLVHEQRKTYLSALRDVGPAIERARAGLEGSRMQLMALADIDLLPTATDGPLAFSISRLRGNMNTPIKAAAATPLQPGDILEVRTSSSMATTGRRHLVATE